MISLRESEVLRNGADGRTRTADLRITSAPLYRLSYAGLQENGAAGQNRTADTRIFSPVLYRLSYRGIQKVAGTTGLEPAASGVTGLRSNRLSYAPTVWVVAWWAKEGSNL